MTRLIGILLAAAYIAMPVDMFPDVMPVVGWMDDAGVALAALWYGVKRRKE